MRNMVFYIVFFVAYVSTTLNAKADFKQNLDSNATTCCVAYNEASQMNFGKKKFFTIAKNDKNTDLNSWSFEQYKTRNTDSKKESNQDVLASKDIQSNNDLDPTNTKQNTDIKTEKTTEYPLLHKESKDELFGTISTAEVPDAIPAPLTTKALLSVEDWRDTYFMYIYNFSPMENPNYIPNELKGQISFRVPIVRNIFKSGGIFYFAFTDTFFFQVFNEAASSPVRDNDFQPEFLFTYPMNVTFWGGTLTELTTGWRHISNGEINIEHGGVTDKSRGSDRWIFKGRWTTKHWGC